MKGPIEKEKVFGVKKKIYENTQKNRKIFNPIQTRQIQLFRIIFQTTLMVNALLSEKCFFSKSAKTVYAGALASFLTQPFEVLKTNMINSPSLYFRDLHSQIISNGWAQYMRGGTIAVIRQGYGFTIYTTVIDVLGSYLESLTNVNKYYRYSIAALTGKSVAMLFEAPLTLIKTRLEVVSSNSLKKEVSEILKNPRHNFSKGLNATLARELVYSFLHYNMYRFFKDDVLKGKFNTDLAFLPAFLAGTIAITVSQPLQVIRSKVSLHQNISIRNCSKGILKQYGWKGYFSGFLPRLCRKPINSGICWGLLEGLKEDKKEE